MLVTSLQCDGTGFGSCCEAANAAHAERMYAHEPAYSGCTAGWSERNSITGQRFTAGAKVVSKDAERTGNRMISCITGIILRGKS